jgi:hypothetical protein
VVADAYPNYSICGIPYYISGEVDHWRNLAHRSYADLEATGMRLRLDTTATAIDVAGQCIIVREPKGVPGWIDYDEVTVGTGAVPVRPAIAGLDQLGPDDGVHVLHSSSRLRRGGCSGAIGHGPDIAYADSRLVGVMVRCRQQGGAGYRAAEVVPRRW